MSNSFTSNVVARIMSGNIRMTNPQIIKVGTLQWHVGISANEQLNIVILSHETTVRVRCRYHISIIQVVPWHECTITHCKLGSITLGSNTIQTINPLAGR